MTYKIVFQTNYAGIYVGETLAQESPLEPGVYLIPGGATEIAPPGYDANTQLARMVNGVWVVEDKPLPMPPEMTPEELKASHTATVSDHLDSTAQALGYSSIYTAVTYADEPAVPKFQTEGQALRYWRSLVWARCYEILDEVTAGTRPVPTKDELIALLPVFTPPAI